MECTSRMENRLFSNQATNSTQKTSEPVEVNKKKASGGIVNVCCLLSCTCRFVCTKHTINILRIELHTHKNLKRLFEITHQREKKLLKFEFEICVTQRIFKYSKIC